MRLACFTSRATPTSFELCAASAAITACVIRALSSSVRSALRSTLSRCVFVSVGLSVPTPRGGPLLVMVAEAGFAPLVSQSRMVMSGMSADRESAAAAAVSAILAGDAVDAPVGYSQIGFASAWDERLGRSAVREFGFKGSMSAEGVFSASLSCDSALGPAVDSHLRSEDPQFFRVDATAVAALRSFDVALAGLAASSGRLESAGSSSGIESQAVGSHEDLEQGSYNDLAQVDEGEDDIPESAPPTPTPVPTMSTPLILPIPDDDLPGGGRVGVTSAH